MAFVIKKTGSAYKELTGGRNLQEDVSNVKKTFWDSLSGGARAPGWWGDFTDHMSSQELILKADELASILVGREKDAVVLEEYTGKALEGRFFLFVEYKDFKSQDRRGIHGDGNMVLSSRGPLKFVNSQSLPDINMPGVGPVTMDMGPRASFINFEGSFLFNSPEESAAWLENRMKGGTVFIFRYKNYHRFVRIARFNYEHVKDDLINYQIGLKFLAYDQEDVTRVIESGSKKTRLEQFAVAELMGRLAVILGDVAGGVSGINNLADFLSDFGDQIERIGSIAGAAANGLSNTVNIFNSNNIGAQLTSQNKRIKKTISHASADLRKASEFASASADKVNSTANSIKSWVGF